MRIIYDWICNDIEQEFNVLNEFYSQYHRNLDKMKAESIAKIKEEIGFTPDDEEYSSVYSSYESHYKELFEKILPNQINYMLIVNLYTFLERNLFIICNDFSRKRSLPCSLESFQGDIGTKLMLYLKCFVPYIYKDEYTKIIKELALFRNIIVHRNGILNSDQKKIQRIINDIDNREKIYIENNVIIVNKC